MNILDPVRSAFSSIWSNLASSILTILMVLIGVSSVVILSGIVEGIKQDTTNFVGSFGARVVIVAPFDINSFSKGNSEISPSQLFGTSSITENDLKLVQNDPRIQAASAMAVLSAVPRVGDNFYKQALLLAGNSTLAEATQYTIQSGQFFTTDNPNERQAVLGTTAAEKLLGTTDAVGKTISISRNDYKVVGIFKASEFGEGQSNPVSGSIDINAAVVLPYKTAQQDFGNLSIHRIIAQAKADADPEAIAKSLTDELVKNHGGVSDISAVSAKDLLSLLDSILGALNAGAIGIAAISLLVGGIGIMNIMLVAVTERTREIGVRKAVGATNGAILLQFLIEALVISVLGALLGLGMAMAASKIINLKTTLHPVITLSSIELAAGIGIGVGIVFGLWPAIRAARKDPIEALRYE